MSAKLEYLKKYGAAPSVPSSSSVQAGVGTKRKRTMRSAAGAIRIVDTDLDSSHGIPPVSGSQGAGRVGAPSFSLDNGWDDDDGPTVVEVSGPSWQSAAGQNALERRPYEGPAPSDSLFGPTSKRRHMDAQETEPQARPATTTDRSNDDADVPRRPTRSIDHARYDSDNEVPRRSTTVPSARYDSDSEVPRNAQSQSAASSFKVQPRYDSDEDSNNAIVHGSAEMSGENATTIYRDKEGRKVDITAELKKHGDIAASKKAAQFVEKYDWNTGAAQKLGAAQQSAALAKAAAAPFSRYAGDEELEAELKNRARDGDPMAARLAVATTATGRPRYSGPPGPANRYGISPGFRWDGIDRGNGWEQRLIAQRNGVQAKKEREYQFRVEDM